MKYFLLFLLTACTQTAQPAQKLHDTNYCKVLASAPRFSCFRYEAITAPKHRWEKEVKIVSPYWAVLDSDKTAVLIAQPDQTCQERSETKDGICPFWIRTVEMKECWLDIQGNPTMVTCPTQLNQQFFKDIVDKKEQEFELK